MDSLRVFISAAVANGPRQEADLAQHLISDLKRAGAEIVIDDGTIPDAQFLAFLERELPRCQWLIVLKTAEALRSLRVQATIHTARQLLKKQEMNGIIQMVCPSSETEKEPLAWPETQTITFQGDYPRVRDKTLLELELLRVEDLFDKDVSRVPTQRLHPIERVSVNEQGPVPAPHQSGPADPAVAGDLTTEAVSKSTRRFALPRFAFPNVSSLTLKLKWKKTPAVSPTASQIVQEDRPLSLPPRMQRNRRWGVIAICTSLILLILISVYLFTFGPLTPGRVSQTPHVTRTARPRPKVLARDTFHRTNQSFWGTASDRQVWKGMANTDGSFSISNNTGQIINLNPPKAGAYEADATLGSAATDVDVRLSGSINAFAHDLTPNLGIVLRQQDATHWYKLLINGQDLALVKAIGANTVSPFKTVPFAAQGGVSYTLRFRAVGSTLFAKVWPSKQTEPDQWMITIQDATYTRGPAGVHAVLENTTQISITAFRETTASA